MYHPVQMKVNSMMVLTIIALLILPIVSKTILVLDPQQVQQLLVSLIPPDVSLDFSVMDQQLALMLSVSLIPFHVSQVSLATDLQQA